MQPPKQVDLRQPKQLNAAIQSIVNEIRKTKGHEIVMVQDPRKGKGNMVPRCKHCKRSPNQRGYCSKADVIVSTKLAEQFAIQAEDMIHDFRNRVPQIHLNLEEFDKLRDGLIGCRPRGLFGQLLEDFRIVKRRYLIQAGGQFKLYKDGAKPGKNNPILIIQTEPLRFGFAPAVQDKPTCK